MLIIHLQAKARQDLHTILVDSANRWGVARAEAYYDHLTTAIQGLAEHPHLGLARDDIKAGYRQLTVQKHDVFYRVSAKKIHIIRVLHQKMYQPKHL